MSHNKDIVEKLSQFNNMSFTKKQWDIILGICGCPKSPNFWKALRQWNLRTRDNNTYTLVNIDNNSFNTIWNNYCISNKRGMPKAEAKKRAQKRREQFKGITFFLVGGALTTEIPERD